MSDAVYDANVVHCANGALAGRRRGNRLDRRLSVIEACVQGRLRPRYNSRLLSEYRRLIRECRNDVVTVFLEILDRTGVHVQRNQVSRQEFVRLRGIGWPGHDQHLIAAALGGVEPTIFTTEVVLFTCGAKVKRLFGLAVVRV